MQNIVGLSPERLFNPLPPLLSTPLSHFSLVMKACRRRRCSSSLVIEAYDFHVLLPAGGERTRGIMGLRTPTWQLHTCRQWSQSLDVAFANLCRSERQDDDCRRLQRDGHATVVSSALFLLHRRLRQPRE